MKVGDLVTKNTNDHGIVLKIDEGFYGARQAFKTYPLGRGKACRDTRKPDFIDRTKDGIRNRVLVLWRDEGYAYESSANIKVIQETV